MEETFDSRLQPIKQKLADWSAGPNPLVNTPDESGRVAGFMLGVWHGAIAPVTFFISLFNENVHVFEVHNTGKGYIAGFLLGASLWAGGGRAGAPRRR